jgi:DNA-binding NtrC family response regulator
MKTTLFAWIGMADLNAVRGVAAAGLGPIGQAVAAETYDAVVLLSDHDKKNTEAYCRWLGARTAAHLTRIPAKLSAPTHFGEIYERVIAALEAFHKKQRGDWKLVFHLSPGTPAMAAVWIIVSKTRFPAALIQSSKEAGVQVVSVPFDISADYLPDLLRKPDDALIRLSQGLPPEAPEFDAVIHRCAAMKRLIAKARRVAPRTIPVLLLGESGTGKELLARAIHRASAYRDGPFVAVNCGAIPRELIESELFGHEKGAFTGAVKARIGYIEEAEGGTLFLDEIGELPLAAQVKLLRVLQEGQVARVGATRPRKVAFRVIAATNRNLHEDVAEGRFREDLFHRVAVAVLVIPPLREREGDLALLTDRLLAQINAEAADQPGFEHKKLSVAARNLMALHPWPGNVRELHNALQRAALWSSGPRIEADDMGEALLPMPGAKGAELLGRPLGEGLDIQHLMTELARHYLRRAMEEAEGNKTRAAKLLGLPSYQTLTNWLIRYEVSET